MHNMEYEILFEDNHLLVVYKSRGVLSQSDISGKLDLLTMLKNYLKVKYNKPGEAYLGLVHRLDRNTSGLIIASKNLETSKILLEEFKNKNNIEKTYIALVKGQTKKEGIYHEKAYRLRRRCCYRSRRYRMWFSPHPDLWPPR